jgi:hypothetical protein
MNVYHTPQYQKFCQEHAFLFSEDCLCQRPGKEPELPQGWTVRTSRYQGGVCRAARHQLLDSGGQVVYTWDNFNDDGEFYRLFPHANGNHYLVFREDLYGYSVLEVETGRTMHYIPEKSWPLDGRQGKETFIWTNVAYDAATSLLAVWGCYWACPNGTLLLDFSDPLEEQDWKRWLDVQDVVDPDLDIYDDIDLERFGEDGLIYFRTSSAEDGARGELTLPTEQVLDLVRAKKLTYKERG